MHLEEKFNFRKIVIELSGTIVGAFFMAVGTALFLLPNQLSSGGFAGVATIFYYLYFAIKEFFLLAFTTIHKEV